MIVVLLGTSWLVAAAEARAPKGQTGAERIAAWHVHTGTPPVAGPRAKGRTLAPTKGAVFALDSWAVQLAADAPPDLAARLGATDLGPIGSLPDWVLWSAPGTAADLRAASRLAASLDADPAVLAFEQQVALPRHSRTRTTPPPFSDPAFRNQFHLINDGQGGGTPGQDANLLPAWALGLTGNGAVIGVVDDGVETAHPDLAPNFRTDLSWDVVDGNSDPNPGQARDGHGTSVAGIAAARDEGTCGVGAAYRAGIAGLRMFITNADGQFNTPDAQKAVIMSHRQDAIDIYNNSWGPSVPYDGPGSTLQAAFNQGLSTGRGGLGNIFIFSAGNKREEGDNVNYDGYSNRRGIIAVGAIGHQGVRASYSEPGTAMFVTAPSSGNGRGTTSTNYRAKGEGNCTDAFGGTSSAAPLVAGVVALLLEARPDLTWRDVQHLLAETAVPPEPDDPAWQVNGAGYRVNPKFGFGRVDAGALTALAPLWEAVPAATSVTYSGPASGVIPDNQSAGVELTVDVTDTLELEHVQVVFSSDHPAWGDLRITLTSPSGTVSELAVPFNSTANPGTWTYMTNFAWGENSAGRWRLRVADEIPNDTGRVTAWSLRLWGTPASSLPNRRPVAADTAFVADAFPLVIDPLANDSDPDGDPLLLLGHERPANAEVRLRSDGRLEVDRPAGEVGDIRFAYTVTDGRGRAAVGRITIIDPRPALQPLRAAVVAGGSVLINPLTGLTLPQGVAVTGISVGPASHGGATVEPNQRIAYFAPPDFSGTATFPVTVSASNGTATTATAHITIAPGDDFAGRFRGDGGWVRMPGGGAFNVRGAFTLEAWIRPRTYGSFDTGFGRIFDKDAIILYLGGLNHAFYDSRSLLLSIDHPDGSSFHGTPPNSIPLNQWTHVAVTYSGASQIRMFINGSEVAVRRYTDISIVPAGGVIDHAAAPLQLGDRPEEDRSFDGLLDEVRFWNVARTPAQIAAARDSRLAAGGTGLIGRWSFDEGTGAPANTGSVGGVAETRRLGYTLGRSFPDDSPATVPGTFDVIAGEPARLDVLTLASDPQGAELSIDSVIGTFPAYAVARDDHVLVRIPAGATEPFTFTYTLLNGPGVFGSGTVTVQPHASAYARWQATTGAGLLPPGADQPWADADADGIPNAIEFLLGTDPLAPEQGAPIIVTPGAPPVLSWPTNTGAPPGALRIEILDPATGSWRPASRSEIGPPTRDGARKSVPLILPDTPAALFRLTTDT